MNTLTRGVAVLGGAAMIIGGGAAIAGVAANAAPARATACTGAQLTVSIGQELGGVGHLGFPIIFRNTSGRTCTLSGYPGLDALNKKGDVLAHARRTESGYLSGAPANAVITVRPRGYASGYAEWVDMTNHGKACPSSRSIAVTAPNTTRTVHRAIRVGICDLQVHPVTSGRTGEHQILSNRQKARKAWIRASKASSTGAMVSDFDRASHELKTAKHDYSTQVRELDELTARLLTGSHEQTRHDREIIRSLDAFFHTPKLFR